MLKRSAGLGSRRGAAPKRGNLRSRRAQWWGYDLEMRASRVEVTAPYWLIRGRLLERYPLVGALLIEIRRSERSLRARRLRRA